MCTAVYLIGWDPATLHLPPRPAFGLIRALFLLVSQDRRHLFVTPRLYQTIHQTPIARSGNLLIKYFCRRLIWLHLPSSVSLHGQGSAWNKERRKTKRGVRGCCGKWGSKRDLEPSKTTAKIAWFSSVLWKMRKNLIWLKQENRGIDHVRPALCIRPSWKQVGK